ncbi:MAG: RNA-directed DNA polymerase [Patescibacteria group bacterium]|nr:RNA-directed DNA polymerase [Patescibacteria group bacterium]
MRRLRGFLLRASRNNTRTAYVLKCDIRKFFASVDHGALVVLLQRRINDRRTVALIEEVIDSFATEPCKGLPLGNLTSQLFANVYLHELDHFVKHILREKYYARYCDDFAIVDGSRRRLEKLLRPISEFLYARLALDIHPDKISVRTWSQGIDFLGYVLLPHCTILRTKTARRMVVRVSHDNLSSYLGLCNHAASHKLEQLIMNKVGLGWNDSRMKS